MDNEHYIRHPKENNLIRYYCGFILKLNQLNFALKLSATNTIGQKILFLIPKTSTVNSGLINEILGFVHVDSSGLDWQELENYLLPASIYPIQRWEGDFETSLRVKNIN